jgi:hypothetical protein
LSIQFELLEPTATATVNGTLLEIAPPSHNVPFDLDPMGFTSGDNLFQSFGSSIQSIPDNVQSSFTAKVNRLAPPVTECLVDANLK